MINTWISKKQEEVLSAYESKKTRQVIKSGHSSQRSESDGKSKFLLVQPNSTKSSNVTNITNIIYNFNIS